MLIWMSIAAFGLLFALLPYALGLIGVVAAAAVWVGLFAIVATAVARGKSRLFARWGTAHLAGVIALPVILMASVYLMPRTIAF